MPKIIFMEHDGSKHEVDASTGVTLMEAAIQNSVPGIDADCGGACACATCHVYVHQEWVTKVGDRNDMEQSMLDFAENVSDASRLACQISIDEHLDGLTVSMPEAQH